MNLLMSITPHQPVLSSPWWMVLLSAMPILFLIVLLGILKKAGTKSAIISLIATVLIGCFAFHFPFHDLGWLAIYSIIKAIFPILIVVIMAIFSYAVLADNGNMDVLKDQISNISTDRCIQVLLITWGFGGILDGLAGFGTAVAIPAAILISLGFNPIFSAVVSCVSNSVTTAYGAVGIPVKVLALLVNDNNINHLGSRVIVQLSPLMYLVPFALMVMTEPRLRALPKQIVLSLLIGTATFVIQYFIASFVAPEIPAILSSIASVFIIVIYCKIVKKNEGGRREASPYSVKQQIRAWYIYGLILILILITCPISPLRKYLAPLLCTSMHFHIYDSLTHQAILRDINISWLTDAGVIIFVATILGGLLQKTNLLKLFALLGYVLKQQMHTIITVCALIALSFMMDFSGMVGVLGVAIACLTGQLYPLFAPLIGCLGTFLTGSDSSASILFAKLQVSVAHSAGFNPRWLAAANLTGATGGKMISPQSIIIATSACYMRGHEGAILKKVIPYAIGYIIIAGLMVYFLPKVLGSMVF